MRTDGQTDMTKLTVAFRNFANVPEPVRYFCEGEKIAVCSKISANLVNAVCGQNVEFFSV